MRAKKIERKIRREQIAQATLDLIGAEGINAVNITEVAKIVGLVPSGIYRHFKNKEELLDATVKLIGKKITANIETVCACKKDALQQLKMLLELEVKMLEENKAIPLAIFSENIYIGSTERKAAIQAILSDYFCNIEKIVNTGQKEGQLRKDIDAMTIVLNFKGILLPAVIAGRIRGEKINLKKHAQKSWKLFCRAISPINTESGKKAEYKN